MGRQILRRVQAVGMAMLLTAAGLLTGQPGLQIQAEEDSTFSVIRTTWEQNGDYLSMRLEDGDGNPVELEPAETAETDSTLKGASRLPSSYSLVDEGYVTSVKDQKRTSLCWAYAALGACESNILKQGLSIPEDWKNEDGELDLSEAALGWYVFTKHMVSGDLASGDDIQMTNKGSSGGNSQIASSALAAGTGLQLEQDVPISDWNTGYSEYQRYASRYRMLGSDNIYEPDLSTYVTEIKNWIYDTGAVEASFYSSGSFSNGADSSAYYQTEHDMNDADHAILLVGWDDNYAKENFTQGDQPSSDGAWLVRNSWGDSDAYEGYFWLSYEEPSICDLSRFYIAEQEDNSRCYQYDGGISTMGIAASGGANVFTIQEDGTLDGVMFPNATLNSSANVRYQIAVYRLSSDWESPTDGTLLTRTSGVTEYAGDKYVALDDSVSVYAGEEIAVVLTLSRYRRSDDAPYLALESNSSKSLTTECFLQENQSFLKTGNNNWIDVMDLREMDDSYADFGNLSLKLFTDASETTTNRSQLETALSLGEPDADSGTLYQRAYAEATNLSEDATQWEIDTAAANLLAGLEQEGLVEFPQYLQQNRLQLKGDVNLDGTVSTVDASEALLAYSQRAAGGLGNLGWSASAAADIDADGVITTADAYAILKYHATEMAGGTPSWGE